MGRLNGCWDNVCLNWCMGVVRWYLGGLLRTDRFLVVNSYNVGGLEVSWWGVRCGECVMMGV
ncbi:hypothetical protein [Candidatus Hodgkinia cicadicola]|uniref:hypothetical protein n=1 Tax=Candidatus Hodgkinia cicadicola TaxID=573658 RepID=UPI0011BA53E5